MNAVGHEAFELGLLIEVKAEPQEEEEEGRLYCFHHLLFLEFIAAKYVSTADKVE